MNAFSIENSNIEDIGQLVVAVTSSTPNQRHIGVGYRNCCGEPKLLHLAWHYDLRNDDFPNDYLWYDIPIDDVNKLHMSLFCEAVYRNNFSGIPYGFAIDDCELDSGTGGFNTKEKYAGMTCASFVVNLFHSQKLEFLNIDSFQHLPEDKTWQRQILQALQKYCPDSHFEYQKKRIGDGLVRLRPEFVAAARHLENPPHVYAEIREHSKQIVEQLAAFTKRRTSGT